MSRSMMTVTDEPEVTDETRFWLTFEVRDTAYSRSSGQLDIKHGERLRLVVEVDEATYRTAHSEATGEGAGGEFTLPLDDYWWHSGSLPTKHYLDHAIWRTRGGFIDWYGS